jgi:hypothetical protein
MARRHVSCGDHPALGRRRLELWALGSLLEPQRSSPRSSPLLPCKLDTAAWRDTREPERSKAAADDSVASPYARASSEPEKLSLLVRRGRLRSRDLRSRFPPGSSGLDLFVAADTHGGGRTWSTSTQVCGVTGRPSLSAAVAYPAVQMRPDVGVLRSVSASGIDVSSAPRSISAMRFVFGAAPFLRERRGRGQSCPASAPGLAIGTGRLTLAVNPLEKPCLRP